MGTRRAQLVAAPRWRWPAGHRAPGAALRAHAGGRAPGGRGRVGGPGLPAVVGLRAGLLAGDAGRAAVPGYPGQAGRHGRAPRRAARPARPGPRGAARPADREPYQPGRADRPRSRGAPAPRGRAVLRRGRRAARPVREDRGPPRLGRAPQAGGADPVPGSRRGAAARGRRAKIGNTPHARPGPSRVSWAGRQRACSVTRERNQLWPCSWTRTRWVARSPWTTWRRRTPPTCRPRTLTASTTSGTGSTRSTARSSAWWTRRTPTRRPQCTARRTGSSPTRSTRSPRAPDRWPEPSWHLHAAPACLAQAGPILISSPANAGAVRDERTSP